MPILFATKATVAITAARIIHGAAVSGSFQNVFIDLAENHFQTNKILDYDKT